MAKTKPIGVRFDENTLAVIMNNEKLETPQQVLSFLEKEYLVKDLKEDAKKEIAEVKISEFKDAKPSLEMDDFLKELAEKKKQFLKK